MSDELRFKDVRVGDTIANRYVLESVSNPDNGEAALFVCSYEGMVCRAKIYYDDKRPSDEMLDKQRNVNSMHIVKKMDQNVTGTHVYQIMPNFNGNIMSKPVNDKIILSVIIPGVLDALKSIHEAGIIHGCVKPGNIFYKPMGDDVVLGDFGVALENIEDCGKNIAMNYLPPEVQDGIYDEKSDYYSLGITLLQLVTGKNPFDGMNKRNIIKKASTMEIEFPEVVSPELQTIIRGLTVKDHDTRWGAEELEKALAGEEVPVVDNFVYVPPINKFRFNDFDYVDLVDIINAFASDWNGAKAAIRSEEFDEYLEGMDEETCEAIKSIISESDDDQALFSLLYAVNPQLPFCWKGVTFMDLFSFTEEFKAAVDKSVFVSVLSDGALYAYEQFIGADDDTVSNIARLTEDARTGKDPIVLAHKMDYLISGQFIYMVEGIPIADVTSLVALIHSNLSELKTICRDIMNDPKFFAWLEVLGYDAQLEEWKKEIS